MLLRNYRFAIGLILAWAANSLALAQVASVAKTELGSASRVHSYGGNLLASQPSASDFELAKQQGIKTIISLRMEEELTWDDEEAANQLGMSFHRVPFKAPESLTDSVFEQALQLLDDSGKEPFLLYCASANRVGAVWLAHRVLHDGLTADAALAEAQLVGLSKPGHVERALAFVKRASAGERSVSPGINNRFVDPDLKLDEWLGRFEVESREVYAARETVLGACNIKPGMRVADVGAGTGFYSRLFASAVGNDGWVYAVDIAPKFLEHINQKTQEQGVQNVSSILCTDRSVRLPPESVDLVFICDVYHHFEYPQTTMASILRALKPGGTLVLIDFERIPGKSREFILGHVRADKQTFQGEIIEAGFRFVEEIKVPSFEENYLLRFRKQ